MTNSTIPNPPTTTEVNSVRPPKLDIQPLHPRRFKEIHKLSVYQLHRLSKYPEETLRHWLADGPAPTGKRYCINGVSLKFIPE